MRQDRQSALDICAPNARAERHRTSADRRALSTGVPERASCRASSIAGTAHRRLYQQGSHVRQRRSSGGWDGYSAPTARRRRAATTRTTETQDSLELPFTRQRPASSGSARCSKPFLNQQRCVRPELDSRPRPWLASGGGATRRGKAGGPRSCHLAPRPSTLSEGVTHSLEGGMRQGRRHR